jgi:hypothetical protein
MQSTLYSCQISIKYLFSLHFIEKYTNIKFSENLSSVSPVVPSAQTDIKLIAVFRNFANAFEMITIS